MNGHSNFSILAKVEARLASATAGTQLLKMSRSLFGEDFKLNDIALKTSAISQAEYIQIPDLLRRVRHLLRVYYDAKLSGRKPAEFKYCDAKDIHDVGLDLHRAGVYLQLSPARLRALFSAAPDIEAFLLDEEIDIGKWRLEAQEVSDAVDADPESDDNDRERVMELEDSSGSDLAAYHMVYFVADLLVAFVLIPPVDITERRRAEWAMGRLVQYSTLPMWRRALGDPLTDTLRPLYASKESLVRFAHAGGLPSLYDDWAQSSAKDGYCKKAVEMLPSRAWEHQTEASLKGVMLGLIHKLEADGEDLVATPLFARIIHEIYSRYGLEPFARGSTLSHSTILFLFLHRRIARKPDAYRTQSALLALLKKYQNVPRTTRKRHGWISLPVSGRWDCLTGLDFGCANLTCPEKEALEKLKEKREGCKGS
ncbi:hypothetical protein BKA93DRAFT_866499 [Sparassis latifolia]